MPNKNRELMPNYDIISLIQEAKCAAQLATSRSASDGDWDSEAYYRAKAEGLQEAENIVRNYDV